MQLLDGLQGCDDALLWRQRRRGALQRRLHREGFFVLGVDLKRAVQCHERLLVVAKLVEAVGDSDAERGGSVRMVYGKKREASLL